MPKSKDKKFKVIPNPALAEAAKGFAPVFGSQSDRDIVDKIFALEKKLPLVNNEVLRAGNRKKMTAKMKQILFEEESLIGTLTRRSDMDF